MLKKLKTNKVFICIDQNQTIEISGKDEMDSIALNFDYMIWNETKFIN